MPSCTGVVQAGNRRLTPDTSTMHRRHAPTGEMFSSQHSVGIYLPPARATCRIVWPSCAATYSPSIRIEILSGKRSLLMVILDVAPQAAAGFVQGVGGGKSGGGFAETCGAFRGRELAGLVPRAFAGLLRSGVAIGELRPDALPSPGAHEALVDRARGLLAVAHGVGNVGCAADQVAPGVELGPAGFEGIALPFQRGILFDAQTGGAGEIGVDHLSHRQDHGVAVDADDFRSEEH